MFSRNCQVSIGIMLALGTIAVVQQTQTSAAGIQPRAGRSDCLRAFRCQNSQKTKLEQLKQERKAKIEQRMKERQQFQNKNPQ